MQVPHFSSTSPSDKDAIEPRKCSTEDCETLIWPSSKIASYWCGACLERQNEMGAKARRDADIERARERLALPPRFSGALVHTFEESYQPTAFSAVVSFVDSFTKEPESVKRGLYLYGFPGSGKTHLAAAIANELIGYTRPNFITAPELLMKIKKTFKPDAQPDANDELLDKLSKSKLLVIDDIGSEKPTEWVREILFVLVDRRYTHYLPTIFTSNHSLDELQKRLGMRVASRIAEMCDIVELKPVDYRIRKK